MCNLNLTLSFNTIHTNCSNFYSSSANTFFAQSRIHLNVGWVLAFTTLTLQIETRNIQQFCHKSGIEIRSFICLDYWTLCTKCTPVGFDKKHYGGCSLCFHVRIVCEAFALFLSHSRLISWLQLFSAALASQLLRSFIWNEFICGESIIQNL